MTVHAPFVTKTITSEDMSLLDRDKMLALLTEANTHAMALIRIDDLDQGISIWNITEAEIEWQKKGKIPFDADLWPDSVDQLLDHLVLLATGLILDHIDLNHSTIDTKDVWPDPKNTCEVTLNAPSVLGLARDIKLGLVKDASITFTHGKIEVNK